MHKDGESKIIGHTESGKPIYSKGQKYNEIVKYTNELKFSTYMGNMKLAQKYYEKMLNAAHQLAEKHHPNNPGGYLTLKENALEEANREATGRKLLGLGGGSWE